MRIAFVNDGIIVCGGLITNYEYVSRLRKLGYEADIYANYSKDNRLRDFYDITPKPIEELANFTDEDLIVANWWMQVPKLENYKGRKVQFIQGKDIHFYDGSLKQKCIEIRHRKNWEMMAVSSYALGWTERQGTIIPNGIHERFFVNHGLERDIDALVEGTPEFNKNVQHSINEAKKDGHKRIVWLGRETKNIPGIETITNPPIEEIPKIYQRAKHFYKHSLSEGFCLPILEAKASGCIIHTHDMGNNFPEDADPKDYTWEKAVNKFIKTYL